MPADPRLPEIAALLDGDRTVHEPARFVVLAILSALASADFSYLMAQTGLTQGNLSGHLNKLESAGLISVRKGFSGKRPRTSLSITAAGRTALASHAGVLAAFLGLTGLGAAYANTARNKENRKWGGFTAALPSPLPER